MVNEDFYTLKGYALMEKSQITASMEDYLEMIYRFYIEGQTIRIKDLSCHLHVKPSSASKMTSNLKNEGLVRFERYKTITLTDQGKELGAYLLLRHDVLHTFFCYINHSDEELEQVEKVEHFISPRTVWNLKNWLENQKLNP